MLSCKYIGLTILKLRLCAVDIANELALKSNLGRADSGTEELSLNMKYVLAGINVLSAYEANPKINLNKIKVSNKGRFFFKDLPESVSLLKLDPDQINCLSEKDICELIKKLLTVCKNC